MGYKYTVSLSNSVTLSCQGFYGDTIGEAFKDFLTALTPHERMEIQNAIREATAPPDGSLIAWETPDNYVRTGDSLDKGLRLIVGLSSVCSVRIYRDGKFSGWLSSEETLSKNDQERLRLILKDLSNNKPS